MTSTTHPFRGFSRDALELLRQLEANNNRPWFRANRQLFTELLIQPAVDLVMEMGPLLRRRLAPGLRAEPRVGGSILRFEHDARYFRERPYRTHLELCFWQGPGGSQHHPGFFVKIGAGELVMGAGFRVFTPDVLLRYRERIDEPSGGRELVGILHRLSRGGCQVSGASLRRVPRPYPGDHERAALLRRLGLLVEHIEPLTETAPEAVLGPILPELLINGFSRMKPLWRWLADLD